MATWTDKQLRGHKRAQGYISSAGATLGVAALGAAGLKSKQARAAGVKLARVANKKSPRVGSKVIRARQRAAGSATGLTTASAGVGGVGGFNFAAIQSQEARKTKVRKMDFEEFAKASREAQRREDYAQAGALVGGVAGAAGAIGASKARPIARAAGRAGKAGYQLQRVVRSSRPAAAASGVRAGASGAKSAYKRRTRGVSFGQFNNAIFAGTGGTIAGSVAGDRIARNKSRKRPVAKSFEEFAKKDWMNITEHQTRARRGNRTKRNGVLATTAGVGAAGLGLAIAGPGAARTAGVALKRTAQGSKALGMTGTKRAKAMGVAAGDVVRRSPGLGVAAGGAGLAGVGVGMQAAGSATRRKHEAAISRQRKRRDSVGKAETFEEFAKAFDPERSRKRRLEAYQAGANMTAGAAGFAGALKIKTQASNAKTALKSGGIKTTQLKAIGRQGAKGAGLLAAGAGAAVGAKKIGDHRKGKGRSYKALTLS